MTDRFVETELLYENPLSRPDDVADWTVEGNAALTFPQDRLRMDSRDDPDEVDEPHFVHWCPERFPDGIKIGWDFYQRSVHGLCMLFFAASGLDGEHVLDDSLDERTGIYSQYFDGDIDTLHASYYRRNPFNTPEISFQTINLRKSKGFHLVERAGDPLPGVVHAEAPYRIEVVKHGPEVSFSIDGLEVLNWVDDGESTGPVLGEGSIGFRQMGRTTAEYENLQVHAVEPAAD
jgi:hypothetical protein